MEKKFELLTPYSHKTFLYFFKSETRQFGRAWDSNSQPSDLWATHLSYLA